ncbi:MAG TPA: 4-vinyl reductase [Anaerolineales bacterium]|nr:4-vinyl reductase [Anaerolineales bacterium]
MIEPRFSNRNLRRFIETLAMELGEDQFSAMLGLSKLPPEWADSDALIKLNMVESAKAYAALQAAMRSYFGRGARGVLLRVGERMWHKLLDDASIGNRGYATIIKRLPLTTRRKSTLELVARFLSAQPGDMTIHTLDLDLLLVDHASPTANGYSDSSPVCFVTQGVINESLTWATWQGHDVEEVACKARGDKNCEFKVTTGK